MDSEQSLFKNRFFAVYMVAFFGFWAAGTAVVDAFELAPQWAVMVGILVATATDRIMEWLQDYRGVKQEVEKNAV